MRSRSLDAAARGRDETFHGRSVKTAGKLLFFRLHTRDDRDREKFLEDAAV